MSGLTHKIQPISWLWTSYLAVMMSISLIYSIITPPFQAPDEFDHVKRAYLLTKGQLRLKPQPGSPSGGKVNQGLLDYMAIFHATTVDRQRKIAGEELLDAKAIQWSKQSHFETPVGTAYYFPLVYLPQAMGLFIGKLGRLSVDTSYRLARAFSLFSCIGLWIVAFRLVAPSAGILCILALPMNLFLASSAVLDPIATALALLTFAAFLDVARPSPSSPWSFTYLVIGVLIVCACRANLLPMLLLPFIAAYYRQKKSDLWVAMMTTVFVMAWTLWTITTTVYTAQGTPANHLTRLLSDAAHPWQFLHILGDTLRDTQKQTFYLHTFIGVLGWLDTVFATPFYHWILFLLCLSVLSSCTLSGMRDRRLARASLLIVTIGSSLLTFLALFIQWTSPTSPIIEGVQGRYFTIPVLSLLYALTIDEKPKCSIRHYLGYGCTAIVAALSWVVGISVLVDRYHTHALIPSGTDTRYVVKPSLPLLANHNIPIHFPPQQPSSSPDMIGQIDILFGTYQTQQQGIATLRLWTANGSTTTVPFDLAKLEDNTYYPFTVRPQAYIGGEIAIVSGTGVISTWETHRREVSSTCLVIHDVNSEQRTSRGCPPAP